jgi:DNA-binding NarL/FixJ family response regulator
MCYLAEKKELNMYYSQQPDTSQTTPAKSLTQPELQIARLICEGKTSKRIAEAMGISLVTTVNHRMNLMQKMDLVRQAIRGGLIELDCNFMHR